MKGGTYHVAHAIRQRQHSQLPQEEQQKAQEKDQHSIAESNKAIPDWSVSQRSVIFIPRAHICLEKEDRLQKEATREIFLN